MPKTLEEIAYKYPLNHLQNTSKPSQTQPKTTTIAKTEPKTQTDSQPRKQKKISQHRESILSEALHLSADTQRKKFVRRLGVWTGNCAHIDI